MKRVLRYSAFLLAVSMFEITGWSQRETDQAPYVEDRQALEPACPTDMSKQLPGIAARDPDRGTSPGRIADYSRCEIPLPQEAPPNTRVGRWQAPGDVGAHGGNTLGGGLAGIYGGGGSGLAGSGGSSTSGGMKR